MKFDIGQRVMTPVGEALVTANCRTVGGVTTSRGQFPETQVTPWIDVQALKADPELMEAWLEEPYDDEPPREIVDMVDEHCQCKCGRLGHCHRVLHKVGDRYVFRSPHQTIVTTCNCIREHCPCLT